jgi:DNA-binding NarL/FixJ family response regulator
MDLLLISDQPLTVLALRAVLSRHEPVANVVDATHLAEAMGLLSGPHDFRLIVLDLDTHGVRPVSTAALLREMWPRIPMALLASQGGPASWVDSPWMDTGDLGLSGCLLKTASATELRSAVAGMLRGEPVQLPDLVEA